MARAIYSLETNEAPLRLEQFFGGSNSRAAQAWDDVELASTLSQFATSNGFQRFSLLVVSGSKEAEDVRIEALDNTPPEFLEVAKDERQRSRDPVFDAYKRLGAPFTYGPQTYVASDAVDLWDEQAQYGYCYGIVSPFHFSAEQHVVVGVDRYEPLPSDPNELTRLVSAFHLFATFVQCTARKLWPVRASEPQRSTEIQLSPRERECLQWAAAGKTAWETGMILSIAEGSVAKFLGAATRKLLCTSKAQAAVKAFKLGLIG